jgi:hypothetical protein
MATQVRNKRSGALIFHQTKDEKQQFNDRKKINKLEKEIEELKQKLREIIK